MNATSDGEAPADPKEAKVAPNYSPIQRDDMHFVHFEQAPPRSWDQFEELCADVFQEEWRDSGLVRNGRAGQSQDGVDIVGRDGNFWPVGIQCKKKSSWPVKVLTSKDLDSEVAKAKNFKPALKAFYLVSTAPDDEKVQARARELTRQHERAGLFTVHVIGWSELVRRATRHPNMAAKHFGAYSSGPATPLLASWRASGAKLLLDKDELAVAIRELLYDFREFPEGRIVFRKKESDDLQFKIRSLEAGGSPTIDKRKKILALREKLFTETYDEESVVAGLKLLLSHPDLSEYIRVAWEQEAPLLVRSFVEQQIDPHLADIKNMEKIRIFPPRQLPEPAGSDIAVFMPKAEYTLTHRHAWDLQNKYKKIDVENMAELYSPVQFGYAIPAILRRIIYGLRGRMPIEVFEEAGWLEFHRWKVSL